jgi:methylenetetrahydrofolate dehydrogenase (NADP+) / methenyltetrahydrofolate cyclohydrolase
MKILRGKKIAGEILKNLKKSIIKGKIKPRLAVVLVGENKASKLYIKLKARAAKKISIDFVLYKLKAAAKEKEVISLIKQLNKDKKISGMIIQLPLPKKLNTDKIIKIINPVKDADGFHAENIKKFLDGKKGIEPVFPTAITKLLESTKINLKNKKAIIVANSQIFGKIMQEALSRKKIISQIILKSDFNRKINLLKNADIVITAVGQPKLIKGTMIKRGVIIIDGGITKKGKKVFGDVDFNSVAKLAGYLSPVPGGVGPVTVACLLENVYKLTFINSKK